jgi:hypothetical protein
MPNERNDIKPEDITMNTLHFSAPGKFLSLVCAIFISGCANLQPVNIAEASGRSAVAKGDTVVVSTHSGETHRFKVVDITADGLHGKMISIPYSDMRLLQIRRIDTQKTIWLTLGIIGVGAIASDDNGGGSGY